MIIKRISDRKKIPVGTRFPPPVQSEPGAHPACCKMGIVSLPGVKCGRGVLLNTHPLLVFGHGTVELYLYPPSGPRRACKGKHLPLSLYILTILQQLIYGRHKDLNLFFKIRMCTRKDLLDICRQFGHAPSKMFASSDLETAEKIDCS